MLFRSTFLIRECVQVAPDTFKAVEYLQRTASLCSFECDVLAEMRHPFFSSFLVPCAGVNLIAAVYYRRCGMEVYYSEPVGQCNGILIHNADAKIIFFSLFFAFFFGYLHVEK